MMFFFSGGRRGEGEPIIRLCGGWGGGSIMGEEFPE